MELEIGKAYSVSNAWKKSVVEIETFARDNENETPSYINIGIVWRGGTYIVTPQTQEEIDELLENLVDEDNGKTVPDGVEICLSDFEEWQLDSTFDGVDEWLEFIRVSDEEEVELREGYAEDQTSYLEEKDFHSTDLEVYIQNGIIIEDAPEYYQGN